MPKSVPRGSLPVTCDDVASGLDAETLGRRRVFVGVDENHGVAVPLARGRDGEADARTLFDFVAEHDDGFFSCAVRLGAETMVAVLRSTAGARVAKRNRQAKPPAPRLNSITTLYVSYICGPVRICISAKRSRRPRAAVVVIRMRRFKRCLQQKRDVPAWHRPE